MSRRNADRPIYDVQDFCPDPPRRSLLWLLVVAALWLLVAVAATTFGAAVAAVAWGDEPATCGMPMEEME